MDSNEIMDCLSRLIRTCKCIRLYVFNGCLASIKCFLELPKPFIQNRMRKIFVTYRHSNVLILFVRFETNELIGNCGRSTKESIQVIYAGIKIENNKHREKEMS